jgi:hypothetical protein
VYPPAREVPVQPKRSTYTLSELASEMRTLAMRNQGYSIPHVMTEALSYFSMTNIGDWWHLRIWFGCPARSVEAREHKIKTICEYLAAPPNAERVEEHVGAAYVVNFYWTEIPSQAMELQ